MIEIVVVSVDAGIVVNCAKGIVTCDKVWYGKGVDKGFAKEEVNAYDKGRICYIFASVVDDDSEII
ncbi:hypothetical protein Glove_87g192 [Diversispora epigaea]|uniref:Uncharacterized protein n=1 Tax=Diversispora epigaea TaxID=1348612 RepID=A0A397J6R5_9GLOM|nr:hypothetical protein Glove_87g192 [Diversispora epigaea]